MTGPFGSFVADPAATRPCVYLSAGSGFAPMRALVEAELEAPLGRSLTLLVSARTEGDVIDRDRILARDGCTRGSISSERSPAPAVGTCMDASRTCCPISGQSWRAMTCSSPALQGLFVAAQPQPRPSAQSRRSAERSLFFVDDVMPVRNGDESTQE